MNRYLLCIFSCTMTALAGAQNVGIGTLTPAAKLDVKTTSSNFVAQFNGIAGSYISIAENDLYRGYFGSFAGADEDMDIGTGFGNTTGKLHLTMQASPKMTLIPNGYVGINTTTPVARLEVKGTGTSSSTNTFMLRNSSNDTIMRVRDDGKIGIGYNNSSYGRTLNLGGSGLNFYLANEAAFGGAIFPTDTSLVLWSNSGANNYLVLQPSWGNTGVGTYTPNAKLHLNGSMLIGNNSARVATGYVLSVDGKIICEELKVQLSTAWPDYVFEPGYQLLSLDKLQSQVMDQKHLPGIPSAKTVEAQQGIEMGDMQKRLLEKVEEAYRYIFELNNENKKLREELNELKTKVK